MRVAERDGRLEPLLACWDAGRALAVLRRRLAEGELSLFGAIKELGADVLSEEEARRIDPELRSFVNVNTPEDLANAVLTLEKY